MNFLGSMLKGSQAQNKGLQQEFPQKQQQIKLIKNQLFFLSKANYKSYDTDPQVYEYDFNTQNRVMKKFNSLFLQCTGHGSYYQDQVAQRFIQYLDQALGKIVPDFSKGSSASAKIKVRIKLTGFDMEKLTSFKKDNKYTFFQKLKSCINQVISFISSFQIRVANMENMEIGSLQNLFGIAITYEKLDDMTNLAYQFSNWKFRKNINQNKKNQIKFDQFKDQLSNAIVGKALLLNLKKFRLQISTFFYTAQQYNNFFLPFQWVDQTKNSSLMKKYKQINMSGKKLQTRQKAFHYQIYRMVRALMEIMPQLISLQLDFRNWFAKFQMNQLKKYFENPDDLDLKTKVSPLSLIKKVGAPSKLERIISQSKIFKPTQIQQKRRQKTQQNQQQAPIGLQIHVII